MKFFHHLTALLLLMGAGTVFAKVVEFTDTDAAIAALFPNETFFEWTSTHGDWNGDGIEDLALILVRTGGSTYDSSSIRLVVLAGMTEGKLTPLSVSYNYCSAQKFFNLEANGASLFVSEVHAADSGVQTTNTLEFQFNSQLGDLELIGRENISESLQDETYRKLSVNYRARTAVEYERLNGRIQEKSSNRFVVSQLARLNAFDCNEFFDQHPY